MKLAPFALFLFSNSLAAQTVGGEETLLHQWDGTSNMEWFGYAAAGAGDVNNDGFDDIIAGSRFASPGGVGSAGSAFVYSGMDGSLLYQWDGATIGQALGAAVDGVGDLNNDGFDEVIVGSYYADPGGLNNAGSAFVYSGIDGSVLYQFDGALAGDQLGQSVASAGDVNQDGINDLVIGAPQADALGLQDPGVVNVYSGATGTLLHQFTGTYRKDQIGNSVASAGDLDGDGAADIIVGADNASLFCDSCFTPGSAIVYSGATGVELYRWDGINDGDLLGRRVAGVGDVNGDGVDDVAFSIAGTVGTYTLPGEVEVHSGADGSLIHQWAGSQDYATLGDSISPAGDFNNDGYDDLLIGQSGGGSNIGTATIYSGIDGSILHQFQGVMSNDRFGFASDFAGDTNGDGISDFVVTDFTGDPGGITDAGSVFVYSFSPLMESNTNSISDAVGGVLDLSLDFSDAAGTYDYITLMSISGTGPVLYGVDIPLTVDSFLLDSATGIYPFGTTSNLHGALDASGNATASITFPAGAFTFAIGNTFWLASVAFPTGSLPVYSSVAIPVQIVP